MKIKTASVATASGRDFATATYQEDLGLDRADVEATRLSLRCFSDIQVDPDAGLEMKVP